MTEQLMTQSEARAEAREWNEQNRLSPNPAPLALIAHTIPRDAWGGAERGWACSYSYVAGAE